METKVFGNNKIMIRELSVKDLKMARQWQCHINELVDENTYLTIFKKVTLAEETRWLKEELKKVKEKKVVSLVAESEGRITGSSHVSLLPGKQNHVGRLGVAISKDYRGCGLGSYLTEEAVKLAEEKLRGLKLVELGVFADNDIAISMYKRIGFIEVAKVPKKFQHNSNLSDEIIMHYYF